MGKIHHAMGTSTISMVIFNSHVFNYQRVHLEVIESVNHIELLFKHGSIELRKKTENCSSRLDRDGTKKNPKPVIVASLERTNIGLEENTRAPLFNTLSMLPYMCKSPTRPWFLGGVES